MTLTSISSNVKKKISKHFNIIRLKINLTLVSDFYSFLQSKMHTQSNSLFKNGNGICTGKMISVPGMIHRSTVYSDLAGSSQCRRVFQKGQCYVPMKLIEF